jgi:5-methylthioadenosine/S-adenosylhomocysteine deaminase
MLERIRSQRVLLRDCDKFVITPAELSIASGRIVGVKRLVGPGGAESEHGSHPILARAPEDALRPCLDLGDRLLTPAFVNAHTHLSLAFLRGVDGSRFQRNLVEDLYFHFESKLAPEDIRAFARMGAYESLLSGVATVWDHYYGETALADALLDTGICGVIAPTLQDLAGPGLGGHERALEATLTIAASPRYREAGVFAALGPHATDTVSPGLLREVATLAAKHDLPIHMHLAQSLDELRRVSAREGCSPLALLEREGLLAQRLLLAHAIFCPRPDLERLAPDRHCLVFCPSSQLQFGLPADVTLWNALGLRWVVATDCASSNDSMGLQKELRFCLGAASYSSTGSASYARFLADGSLENAESCWRERLTRVEGERSHTTNDALLERVFSAPGALHPSFRAGTIEVGALANLIAWNLDHPAFWPGTDLLRGLALADTNQAIHALIVRGAPIAEIGNMQASLLASDGYRTARSEADARLAALLRI